MAKENLQQDLGKKKKIQFSRLREGRIKKYFIFSCLNFHNFREQKFSYFPIACENIFEEKRT